MKLRDFFAAHPVAALAFSGGLDSSYLLYEGLNYAERLGVYYVKSAFQPAFELADALRLAEALGAAVTVLEVDVLSCPEVAANPPDRCYYCKQRIMSTIKTAAERGGFPVLLDGTNASDDASDRPGMRALQELSVLSPLRMGGLTKEEIRRKSKEAGLFTWNKPAYACLATRTPAGEALTARILRRTEQAETALHELGFRDFRVRHSREIPTIEVTAGQMDLLSAERERVSAILRECGYDESRLITKLRNTAGKPV